MSKMRVHEIEIPDANIFEILLYNFPDIVHSINDKGCIVYTNKKAEELLGYTHDELLSMNVRQLYPEDRLKAMDEGFSDLKEKGEITVPESALQAKDGTRIPVEIRSFAIYDDDGNFLRSFSVFRDIRKVKELQNGLVHAERLAAIGELAAGVAHDINNPLMTVMLANKMLMKSIQTEEPDLDDALLRSEDIERASKSIQKLSRHLRNFSRGVTEKYEMVDLAVVVSDALFLTNNKVMSADITVENGVTGNSYPIRGCPNRMEQVLINLVSNACDAMHGRPERRIGLLIETCDRGDQPFWRLDVSDTGSGIAPDILEEVFQSFFTTKPKGKGTGLGLSISRGIVHDHGGEIEASSHLGKGTTFSVYLPRV